mgnify:CR=1 FL=1
MRDLLNDYERLTAAGQPSDSSSAWWGTEKNQPSTWLPKW